MPTALTQRFGALAYEDASALRFPGGLPGFEDHYRFVIVEQRELSPIVFLQSLESADLCFLALPVQVVEPSYEAEISPDDLEAIGLDPSKEYVCLALLASAENGRLTANLLAPVVINPSTRTAVQSVRSDTRYSHQHALPAAVCS
jgi:flagellar assembly factor FliW